MAAHTAILTPVPSKVPFNRLPPPSLAGISLARRATASFMAFTPVSLQANGRLLLSHARPISASYLQVSSTRDRHERRAWFVEGAAEQERPGA